MYLCTYVGESIIMALRFRQTLQRLTNKGHFLSDISQKIFHKDDIFQKLFHRKDILSQRLKTLLKFIRIFCHRQFIYRKLYFAGHFNDDNFQVRNFRIPREDISQTGYISHAEDFTYRTFYDQEILHTGYFTYRTFYIVQRI